MSYWRWDVFGSEALDPATLPDGERSATRTLVDVASPAWARALGGKRLSGRRPKPRLRRCCGLPAAPWSKNLLALAAPCAAGWIDRPVIATQALGAFVMLCMISSATYLVNDVRDREQDRRHPRKRNRPWHRANFSPRRALWIAAILAVTGIALATAITPGWGCSRFVTLGSLQAIPCGCVGWGLTSWWLQRGSSSVRSPAGWHTDIYLSRWFVIVTACCAIFLVTAKRYAELRVYNGDGVARATLRSYSLRRLRFVLLAAAAAAITAYTSWAFTRLGHTVWYVLSIIRSCSGSMRYSLLIGRGGGQAPEELILHDRVLLVLGVAWSTLFIGGVYVSS